MSWRVPPHGRDRHVTDLIKLFPHEKSGSKLLENRLSFCTANAFIPFPVEMPAAGYKAFTKVYRYMKVGFLL